MLMNTYYQNIETLDAIFCDGYAKNKSSNKF